MRRLVSIGVAVLLAVPAAAHAGSKRVAVVGSAKFGVAARVRKALARRVELVAVDTRPRSRRAVQALAREHRLDAVLTVAVATWRWPRRGRRSKRYGRATLTLRDGKTGRVLARFELQRRSRALARATARRTWRKLRRGLRKARRPAAARRVARAEPPPPPRRVEPEPKPRRRAVVDNPDTTSAGSADTGLTAVARSAPRRGGRPAVSLGVDGRAFLRQFRYNDDLFDTLRTYDISAPAVGITATYRPFASTPWFALRGELELAVGVDGSRTEDGMQYDTSSSEWSLTTRLDKRLGSATIGLDLAVGEHRFKVGGALIPDVTYRWARGGLAYSHALSGRVSVDAAAGYRYLISAGQLTEDMWFPRATGAGIDAELGARVRASDAITLFARADVRRYFFAMNPEPGDAQVAGGAIDQYMAVIAGVVVVFGR